MVGRALPGGFGAPRLCAATRAPAPRCPWMCAECGREELRAASEVPRLWGLLAGRLSAQDTSVGNGGAGQGARGAGGCGLRAWVCPGTLGVAAVSVPRGMGEPPRGWGRGSLVSEGLADGINEPSE